MKYYIQLLVLVICFLSSCNNASEELPYIGKKQIKDGAEIHHKISDWSFMRQDGEVVTNETLSDYIYVTDFFFTSCPTICPRVMREMKKIYTEFENDERVKLVSFTIDPERDTPEKLTDYADKLGVNQDKWWFLNSDKETTYDLANEYFIVAYEDESVEGGFDHSGKIILVDKNGHVRSFTEGTEPESTDDFIKDIHTLLKSYE